MNYGKMNLLIIIGGMLLLAIASPLFAFYNLFPRINNQIGPHQLSSWVALLIGFIGFVMIIYGSARHNI